MPTKIEKTLSAIASEFNYRAELVKYASKLPKLSPADRKIVAELKREGIAITSLDALSIPSTPQLLEATKNLLPQLQQTAVAGNLSTNRRAASSHCLYGNPVTIAKEYPVIFLWGLQDRILDILESYYGAPVSCIGINMRRDLADGQQNGTKLWHMDGEDRKVVKISVYLNDVDENGGPFEYIPMGLTPSYKAFKNATILDEDMKNVVPASQWKSCTGAAGTVIIADNAKFFHHGKTPLVDRYTLFYAYAYRNPKRPEMCKHSPWRKGVPFMKDKLSQRQRESIWNYQELF